MVITKPVPIITGGGHVNLQVKVMVTKDNAADMLASVFIPSLPESATMWLQISRSSR